MRTISCKLEDLKTMTLHIGYEGENDYTSVRIDAGSVFAQYPEAVPSLKVQPPKGNMYPVIVTRDGDIVIWNVSDSDTASNGNGEIQLTFTENTVVVKSCTGKTLVHRSLKATGPAPDPLIDFIDRAEEVVGEAQDAAEAAEAAAQHAPMIGLDGYWYKWDAETEGYVKTDTKARGEDGANGVGITSVEKISTVGLVDTYRINFTNGTNTTYTVTNGQDGSVPIDDTTPAANKVFSSAKVDEELTDVKNAIQGVDAELDAKTSDIISLIGQSTIKNKTITGNSTYQAVIKMDLYANTLYSMNLKLKNASSVSVYYKMVKSDGTTIGYSDSISAGNTYAYKAVTPSEDCLNAEFHVSSSADFVIEYANIFSQDGLMQKIGKAIIGDDITMLSVTSSNKKSISGAGTINTETDSTMYVTDDIEIKQGHWYMVTASAGYSAAYYAILDADKNVMMVERAPSGSGTVIINKMVYMPSNSKYIRIAYVSSISGGLIAICNTIKTRKYEAPEWWNKFLAISYSDIGVAHTNSLETFVSAGHFGFPVCKGDVRPTSDNKLIMCHDGGFTFDGNGRITVYNSSDRTLIHNITHDTAMEYEYAGQESASENNHYQKVCDIDDYLQTCKQYGMIAFITAREDYISTVCTELINALKRNNMLDRAIINSYTAQTLSYIRMLDDNLPLSFVQSDNYNLGTARVNVARGYRNMAITLVSTEANMRTYLTGLASVIADANSKGVGIMYAQPRTLEDVEWLRQHGIMGAQIGRPCLPYRFEQIKFKVSISSGVATLSEWFGMTTMEADVSQSGNVISISEFKVAGTDREFSDLIMEYWMNRFPYRITAISENGNAVTATWQNNALKLTVSDISTSDTIDVIVEV